MLHLSNQKLEGVLSAVNQGLTGPQTMVSAFENLG